VRGTDRKDIVNIHLLISPWMQNIWRENYSCYNCRLCNYY